MNSLAPAAPAQVGIPAGRLAALACGLAAAVITAATVSSCGGALLWGGSSVLGLDDRASAIAGAIGALATLPIAFWLGLRAYRIERAGLADPGATV